MTDAPEEPGAGYQVYLQLEEEYPPGSETWSATMNEHAIRMPYRCSAEHGKWLLGQMRLAGQWLQYANERPCAYLVGNLYIDGTDGYVAFQQFDAADFRPVVTWHLQFASRGSGQWAAFRFNADEPFYTHDEFTMPPDRVLDEVWQQIERWEDEHTWASTAHG